jgi:hypothetical protein
MDKDNFNKKLQEEIEAISIEAKSRGFGVSKRIIYKTDFTTIVVHAFLIPREDGTIHHFDLKINKYKRKRKNDPWEPVIDELEEHDHGIFQSLKLDAGNGEAVKNLTEFLNAQFKTIGKKIEKKKIIIDNPEDIDISLIKKLDKKKLQSINSLVSVKALEDILKNWKNNKTNDNEEFWINLFQNNSWILSQIFSCPFIHIGTKFYCGGKEDDDRGGVKGDLLYKNNLTGSLAFIEIKTPETKIISKKYRGDDNRKENIIYSMSDDLTGGVNQVLNQRKVYQQHFGDNNGKILHNSKCILIIGKIENLDVGMKRSFEFYRSSLREVEIITYDELFDRISALLNFLKEN